MGWNPDGSPHRGALVLILLTVLSSCGIPEIVVLEAPDITRTVRSPATIDFEHSTANDRDDFLGYELYYKFYETEDSVFANDRSALENASPSAATNTLASRGYRRVHALDDTNQQPVIAVSATERDSSFTLTVSYPPNVSSDETAIATWETQVQNLARDLGLFPNNQDASFAPGDIELTDPDMPSFATAPIGTISMGLAIVAYGIDFTNGTFSAIYSEVVVVDRLLEVFF